MTPGSIRNQIDRLIRYLMEASLTDDQNFAIQRDTVATEITFNNAHCVSRALKGAPYPDIYAEFARNRAFNAKLLDGALLQMGYIFTRDGLERHRLAFFSAPHLDPFQRAPDLYNDDELYADILARRIAPLGVRFDYNARDSHHQDVSHPRCHLTLGEYEHCRIPVSKPLTPYRFVDFIIRNFYRTASVDLAADLPYFGGTWLDSITPAERQVLHLSVPSR